MKTQSDSSLDLVLRPATSSDLSRLVQLEKLCFSSPNWDERDFSKYDCEVAEIKEEIVAFLISREILPGEREILNLAVDPAFRQQGIAMILLRSELAKASTHFLEVRASNCSARKLYLKAGFFEVGRRNKYYRCPEETAIVMRSK